MSRCLYAASDNNKQTIRLLEKEAPKLQTAIRHVNIHQCWLRQEVQEGRKKIKWVPTIEMIADGFTKLLPPQKNAEFVNQLQMDNIEDMIAHLS